jgi:glycosidase
MMVNPNKNRINVTKQDTDEASILNFYRKMIRLRKENPVLVYGDCEPIETDNEDLFCYFRTLGKEKWLVMLNFSDENSNFPKWLGAISKLCRMSNYETAGQELRPWECLIYQLE